MGLLVTGTYVGIALHVFWPGLPSLFLDEMIGVPFWTR